jgi:hypothetical protein
MIGVGQGFLTYFCHKNITGCISPFSVAITKYLRLGTSSIKEAYLVNSFGDWKSTIRWLHWFCLLLRSAWLCLILADGIMVGRYVRRNDHMLRQEARKLSSAGNAFLSWGVGSYWGLNSGPDTCYTRALPLEPHPEPLLL